MGSSARFISGNLRAAQRVEIQLDCVSRTAQLAQRAWVRGPFGGHLPMRLQPCAQGRAQLGGQHRVQVSLAVTYLPAAPEWLASRGRALRATAGVAVAAALLLPPSAAPARC